jgi:hypothetical protein
MIGGADKGNINDRLDKLKNLVQDRDFLEGKGLSNEVNIRIFCYDPKDEMTVEHFIGKITADPNMQCNIVECNLYKLFIEICEDLDILDSIPEMEESEGSAYLLEQLHSAISEDEFISKMRERYWPQVGDVMMLTGVGDVFPFMRVHKMLEAMQPYFSNIPVLVMYPGVFDGNYLRLFDKLEPNPYYRAFNVL